jgi:hypothetical protein
LRSFTLIGYVVLALVPGLPLLFAWYQTVAAQTGPSMAKHRTVSAVSLVLLTMSYTLIIMGMFYGKVIGEDYSNRRFATIWTNLAIAISVSFLGLILKKGTKGPFAIEIAGGALAGVWLYLAWISSVV